MGFLKQNSKSGVIQDILYYTKKYLILEPIAIILAFYATFSLILLLVLCIPVFIYRLILGKTFKYFRPDLDKPLRSGQSLFASLEKYHTLPQNNIIVLLKFKGVPDIENIRSEVNEKLVKVKSPNGNVKYPEFHQYPYKWMGYLFWKDDKEFDISNHVYYYSNPNEEKVYTDTEAAEIETKLHTQSFTKDRSLWNMVIVPNVETTDGEGDPSDKHYIIFFVLNHCYGDGYNFIGLILSDLGGYDLSRLAQPKHDVNQRNIFQKVFYVLSVILFCAYDYFRPGVVGNVQNVWRVLPWKMKKTFVSSKPLKVSTQFLKDIRHKHNTSLPSVIIAGWCAALRKSAGITGKGAFDRKITVTVPGPMPNHPDYLDIHASVLNMLFPIGIEDPVERLKEIDKYLKKQRRSKAIAVGLALKPICGLLLPDFIGFVYPLIPTAAIFNVFPGPEFVMELFGHKVTSTHFTNGQTKARFSTLFTSLTYNKDIVLKTSINTGIFKTSTEIDEFNALIKEEFDLLANQDQKYTHLTQGKYSKTDTDTPV